MLKESKRYLKNNKNNLIILTKDRINTENDKNKRNNVKSSILLTLKGDDFTLKRNLSYSNNINKEKILQTVTSMKKQLIDDENNRKYRKDRKSKYSLIKKENIFIDSKDSEKLSNYDLMLNFNDNMIKNKNEPNLKKRESEKTGKQSNKAKICKANSELDKYTELENKKKTFFKNPSKFVNKPNKNDGEELIENNNISVYEYINFNNDNNKIKDSSNNNESNFSKAINNNNNNNIKNNFINNTNIYNIKNLESNNTKKINSNLGNIIRFKNNFIKCETSLNNKIKKKGISSDFSNSIKNNINNNSNNQNDNISENKKLIKIKRTHKRFNSNLENKIESKNPINSIISNSNDKNILLEKKNRVLKPVLGLNKKIPCFICEKAYKKNIFVPKCQIHYLCKKCLKSYYEDIFENNNFSLKCPDTNCDKEIDFNILKNIISNIHYEMFINNKKAHKINNNTNNNYNIAKELYLKDTKLIFNSKVNNENIKLYTQKHVLDINSNEKFYMYNKNKDIYCNNCLKPTLFTKPNGHFIKCLNCHYKTCKYCLKEFEDLHMDIKSENHCKVYYYRKKKLHMDIKSKNHCKVYYRKDDFYFDNQSKKIFFLLQLFFVIAMYYLMFAGLYLIIFRFLKDFFKLKKYNSSNCCFRLICYCFIGFIPFIFLLIVCPFLIIIHPFFSIILSLTDY